MPTGWRSVYLDNGQQCTILSQPGSAQRGWREAPARDLKGRAKDLGAYKFGHCDLMAGTVVQEDRGTV